MFFAIPQKERERGDEEGNVLRTGSLRKGGFTASIFAFALIRIIDPASRLQLITKDWYEQPGARYQ